MGRQGGSVRMDSSGHSVPAGRQPDGQKDPPASRGVGGFSFVVTDGPEVQLDFFEQCQQLPMFLVRQAS